MYDLNGYFQICLQLLNLMFFLWIVLLNLSLYHLRVSFLVF